MKMKKNIFNLIFFIVFLILFNKYYPTNNSKSAIKSNYQFETNKSVEELKQIFKKYGTDKFFHKYYNFYGKFLGPIRNEQLEVLEIGLGCGMIYGPGKSLLAWKEYLPNSKISILEKNQTCALSFKNQTKNLFIGSQSDPDILKKTEIGSPYDIIIDDGGHSRSQQTKSLIGLFPLLKKGGIYVIEDFYFSFIKESNDSNRSAFDILTKLILLFNPVPKFLNKIDQFKYDFDSDLTYLYENVEYIVCFWHACALFKKIKQIN